jgi:hypothetical protein
MIVTNTVNYRQNGRDAANAERGALKRWLIMTAAIRETGPSDSDQYAAAREESRDGYVERGGQATSFKTKLSNCNVILDAFKDQTIDEICKSYTSVPDAYRAAKTPVDSEGNRVVTVKSADERKGDFRSAVRLALGAGVSTDELRAIIAEEAAKLA